MPRPQTQRLVLREWRDDDLAPFAALNRDPAVVQHLMGPLTPEESAALVERITEHWHNQGFGLWVVECPKSRWESSLDRGTMRVSRYQPLAGAAPHLFEH